MMTVMIIRFNPTNRECIHNSLLLGLHSVKLFGNYVNL
jgi:hypothetical protein